MQVSRKEENKRHDRIGKRKALEGMNSNNPSLPNHQTTQQNKINIGSNINLTNTKDKTTHNTQR